MTLHKTLTSIRLVINLPLILFALTLPFSSLVHAESQRILLNDGTEIIGEVVSLRNGAYTIRSETLGTLTISDRQVRQISRGTSATSAGQVNSVETAKSALNSNQLQAIQQRLLGDSSMLQQIMSLQSSPEMQAILADPEVMAAIQNLDMDTLANNPKIKRLMNHQDVRAISGKVN